MARGGFGPVPLKELDGALLRPTDRDPGKAQLTAQLHGSFEERDRGGQATTGKLAEAATEEVMELAAEISLALGQDPDLLVVLLHLVVAPLQEPRDKGGPQGVR